MINHLVKRGNALWQNPLSLSIVLLLSLGCAVQRPVEKAPVTETYPPPVRHEPIAERDPFEGVAEKYRQDAVLFERGGDLAKALFYWKVVLSFTPKDQEVSERVVTLKRRIRTEAENHFQKGLESLRQNAPQRARKEFLAALALNPEHPQALEYLKVKLNEPVWTFYEIKRGDTLRRISEEIYRDPDKDFLIAYFNDLEGQDTLKPGTLLKLPPSVSVGTAKKGPPGEMVPRPMPPSRARALDPSIQEQADIHYAKGVKYFLSEDLEKAIEAWEETLRINPDHSRAKRDLQKARRMLKHLKNLP